MPLTVRELRLALAEVDASQDHLPVVVWLPGSRIDLESPVMGQMATKGGMEFLIEGNVRAGSALDSEG